MDGYGDSYHERQYQRDMPESHKAKVRVRREGRVKRPNRRSLQN